MLTTNQLHIDGRRHTLLPATTLEARRSEVLLIQADGQERRTALALALTGRMKPSTGSVSLGHDASLAGLRRRSAIIDAPDVNAPENHLTVRSLASEDLALVPFKFRDRTRPTAWLVKHGFRDILGQWIEELAPARLLQLQLELALTNRDVDVVVVDSPDRHTADTTAWLPLLEQLAAGTMGRGPDVHADTPLRPLVVVGVVGRIPDEWTGATEVAGNGVLTHDDGDLRPVPVPDVVPEDGTDDDTDEDVSVDDAETSELPAQPVSDNDVSEPDRTVAPASEIDDGSKHDSTQQEEEIR
ncbi:ABC transporter ATP-binding protein [Arthrobacter sp. TWP1-1]|uniref:ABC transporter ATP-binding protein n=1 Tax=Arthrobacter sp. TWP1-1 TaxID=2804568 RepID=UPI003CF7DA02